MTGSCPLASTAKSSPNPSRTAVGRPLRDERTLPIRVHEQPFQRLRRRQGRGREIALATRESATALDPLLTGVFATILPAVQASRAVNRDAYGLKDSMKIDPKTYESQASQTVHYAAGGLGFKVPDAVLAASDRLHLDVPTEVAKPGRQRSLVTVAVVAVVLLLALAGWWFLSSRSATVTIDGKTLGTLAFSKNQTRTVSTPLSSAALPAGPHTLAVRFSG